MEASSKEMCQKVEDMILQDCHIKISVITHELGISASAVSSIIHSILITPEQKACHKQFSEENLDMLRTNPENFSRIITGDETWVRYIIMILRPNKSP